MYHDMLYVLGKVDMEETIAYLDNAATTRPCPEAVQAVMEAMERGYGNPSSLHRLGAAAARAIAVKVNVYILLPAAVNPTIWLYWALPMPAGDAML